MTSQKFPFRKGTSHPDSILTLWNRAKLKKITFMPENIFSGTKLRSSLHFHGVQAKQKIHMFNFSRCLISKTATATPLVNRFCLNSAKMCLMDKKIKSPTLEVLDRAVLRVMVNNLMFQAKKLPPPRRLFG